MEVAIVVQRYGKKIIGGAESHARLIAEKLAANLDWKVHVFTTTAHDYITWQHEYQEGLETINGVLVHRFKCAHPRRPKLFGMINRFLTPVILRLGRFRILQSIAMPLERLWYSMQGPFCPALLSELVKQQNYFDQIFFFTYLYYPTIYGLPLLENKATLIPTAHDEPPFFFLHTKKLFHHAQRILANSEVEASLIEENYPETQNKMQVVGLGFDEANLDPSNTTAVLEQRIEGPYLVYLGRISKGKKVDELISHFTSFVEKAGDRQTKLVLAGEVEVGFTIPSHSQILAIGVVQEQSKARLITKAKCLVNPSPKESLSMVLIEALALKVPALVNMESEVLADYEKKHASIFGYNSKEAFAEALSEILAHDWQSESNLAGILTKGRDWAIDKYSWQKVLSTYQAVVERH